MNFRLGEVWESPRGVRWRVEMETMHINYTGAEYARLCKIVHPQRRIEVQVEATKGWKRLVSQEERFPPRKPKHWIDRIHDWAESWGLV
jgi:hypothetical protein